MRQAAMLVVVLAVLGGVFMTFAPQARQPKLSREAAMQMVRDSVWANPIFFSEWDQEKEVVVTERFEARDYVLKTIICEGHAKARAVMGFGPDYIILESFNHKPIGEWKNGKLRMY